VISGSTPINNTMKCKECQAPLERYNQKVFCGSSCAAKFNNRGRRRHGKPANDCLVCGKKTASSARKYCSRTCSGTASKSRKYTIEEQRKLNRMSFMKYYMKKKSQTPADADHEQIKEIYKNCPDNMEVDHIIPVSLGGLHHQDNLQYLTSDENKRKGNRVAYSVYPRQF